MRSLTADRPVKVKCGPNYRPGRVRIQRKARRSPSAGYRSDAGIMLARSLTKPARRLAEDPEVAAGFLEALALTAVGRARSIYRESDGSLSCALPIKWGA